MAEVPRKRARHTAPPERTDVDLDVVETGNGGAARVATLDTTVFDELDGGADLPSVSDAFDRMAAARLRSLPPAASAAPTAAPSSLEAAVIDVDAFEPAQPAQPAEPAEPQWPYDLDYTKRQLKAVLAPILPDLRRIAAGELASWRHDSYMGANLRARNALSHQSGFMAMTPDTMERLVKRLLKQPWPIAYSGSRASEEGHPPNVTYVMQVPVPETVIRIMQQRERRLSYDDADQRLRFPMGNGFGGLVQRAKAALERL